MPTCLSPALASHRVMKKRQEDGTRPYRLLPRVTLQRHDASSQTQVESVISAYSGLSSI